MEEKKKLKEQREQMQEEGEYEVRRVMDVKFHKVNIDYSHNVSRFHYPASPGYFIRVL